MTTMTNDPKNPPTRHVLEVLRDGQWAGEPAWVIGGGESIKSLDMEKLGGQHVVGTNQAWKHFPGLCDVVVFADGWLVENNRKHEPDWGKGREIRLWPTKANHQEHPEMHWLLRYGPWSKSLKAGIWGESSQPNAGMMAVNLADILGADPILLVGFDLWKPGVGYKVYHNDYAEASRGGMIDDGGLVLGKWLKKWKRIAPQVRAKVYNCNPDSGLQEFERITFEEGLRLCKIPMP